MVLHTPPSQLMMQTDAPFLPASTCELLPFSYEKKSICMWAWLIVTSTLLGLVINALFSLPKYKAPKTISQDQMNDSSFTRYATSKIVHNGS